MDYIETQLSGMAGEFLTVGKLFKLGLQASVTFGNAKSIDVLAYNQNNDKTYVIQVKTCKQKNCFPIKKERINPDHIYVFIILNDFSEKENYYIIKGNVILSDINKYFGSSYKNEIPSSMPAINYGPLKEYEDNWKIFNE